MPDFNKHVGKFIDKATADKHIKNWKKTNIESQSSFIGADIIMDLLTRPNVIGLRIHYAMDDQGVMQPIFTAEYPSGAELKASAATATATTTNNTYANSTMTCPPLCP